MSGLGSLVENQLAIAMEAHLWLSSVALYVSPVPAPCRLLLCLFLVVLGLRSRTDFSLVAVGGG